MISFNVFLLFVKRSSVESLEVRELDCCRPDISALIIELVSLLIINVSNASHVLLWFSINAGGLSS